MPGGKTSVGTMTRRAVIGAMAAAGVGYALFGPKGMREAPRGRLVLDYWEKWTGQEGQAMRRVVDAFNQSQDRIWVRYFSMGAIDQKSMIAIAGGDPPDLAGLWNFSIPSFSEADAILPLDGLIESEGDRIARAFRERYGDEDFRLDRSHYTGPAWELMRRDGQMWGAVNTCSSMGLVWSKEAFREAGVDPERAPKTIEELDALAERLTVFDADGSLRRAGFIHREPGWWNWIWGFYFGGRLYDQATKEATAAAPENVRAYDWVQTYPEKYGASRLVSFQSGFGNYNSAQQALLTGKVAMVLHGAFLANVVQTFEPGFEYGAAPFPVEARLYDPERPIGLLESDLLTIPRGAPNPEAAFEFLCFTQRRWAVETLARGHAKPTPLAVASDDFVERHPNRAIEAFNAIVRSPRAFPKPQTTVWPQYEDEFNAQIGAIWKVQRPAGEILEGIERRMQRQIDDALARRARREDA